MDNLIALYDHRYAVLRDTIAAISPTEDAEDDLRRNARAVLAAEHQRFVSSGPQCARLPRRTGDMKNAVAFIERNYRRGRYARLDPDSPARNQIHRRGQLLTRLHGLLRAA